MNGRGGGANRKRNHIQIFASEGKTLLDRED